MTRKEEKWNDISGIEGSFMIRKYSHAVLIYYMSKALRLQKEASKP